ncbi:OmpA family protein [Segnochrobactraceae bacterium EtOH-i3]
MRLGSRRRRHEEEDESAFVSMTDMTVSFLFIVIILLAFFASQLQDDDMVSRARFETVQGERDTARADVIVRTDERDVARSDVARLEETVAARDARIRELEEQLRRLSPDKTLESYLNTVATQRVEILKRLQERLKVDFPDLQVIVSDEMDALRFKGDGLFQRGSSQLAEDKREIVRTIARRLDEILPCFTLGPQSHWQSDCNPAGALIEALQIEGHTDSDGQDTTNLTLSTARANETFFTMTGAEPDLTDHRNRLGQPVLSVAGYGEMRPVADNTTPEGKATNRRIDLRLIMYIPSTEDEVERVRAALRRGVAPGGPP